MFIKKINVVFVLLVWNNLIEMELGENKPSKNGDLYSTLWYRLNGTVHSGSVGQGQLVLLATEPGLTVTQSDSGTIIKSEDGGIFTLSKQRRLISSQTPVPYKKVRFEGERAGYRHDYIYGQSSIEHAHTQIDSYVTTEGQIIKDVERKYLPDGTNIGDIFFDHTTSEPRKSKDQIQITDEKGDSVRFSIGPIDINPK